jgi:hypothetical protein
MNIAIRVMFISGALLTASCATLNKDECQTANWEVIGYEDGTRGYNADRIGQHREACSKHGVAPDLAAYAAGRDKGLRVYCTPQNGYRIGQKTTVYRDVCPEDLRADFRKAFEYGGQILAHQREISRYQTDIRKYQDTLQEIEQEIALNEALIIKGAKGPAERARLIERNRELQAYINEDRERIDRAAYEIEQLQILVGELQENSPYR